MEDSESPRKIVWVTSPQYSLRKSEVQVHARYVISKGIIVGIELYAMVRIPGSCKAFEFLRELIGEDAGIKVEPRIDVSVAEGSSQVHEATRYLNYESFGTTWWHENEWWKFGDHCIAKCNLPNRNPMEKPKQWVFVLPLSSSNTLVRFLRRPSHYKVRSTKLKYNGEAKTIFICLTSVTLRAHY